MFREQSIAGMGTVFGTAAPNPGAPSGGHIHRFKAMRSVSGISILCCALAVMLLCAGPGGKVGFPSGSLIIVHLLVINLSHEQHNRMEHGTANRRLLPASYKAPCWVGAGKGALLTGWKSVLGAFQECWEKAGWTSETSQYGCGFREMNANVVFLENPERKTVFSVYIASRYIS